MSGDSVRYAQWADELIASNFDVFAVKSQAHNYASQYIVFIYLVAVVKVLFGSVWLQVIAALNVIFNMITLVLLLKLLSQFTKSVVILVLAGGFYLVSYDIIVWTKFMLSDSLYLLLSFLFFIGSLHIAKQKNDSIVFRKSQLILTFFLFLVCLVTRPTAIPLIVYLIVVVLVINSSISQSNIQRTAIITVLSLLFVTLLGVFSIGVVMADPSVWSFDAGKEVVYYYSERFMDGAVVHDRPETYIQVESRTLDFMYLTFLKFINFFTITLSGYSNAHSAYNIAWLTPVYLFSVFALVELFRKQSTLPVSALLVILLGFLYVYIVAAFTAVTLLDYDHRYRIPVLPILIMMASLGAVSLIQRVRVK